VLHDALVSALRFPLIFRGDVMRPSSLAVLAVATPLMLLFLSLKVRAGMRFTSAVLWAILGLLLPLGLIGYSSHRPFGGRLTLPLSRSTDMSEPLS
jgi:hypothetical protein